MHIFMALKKKKNSNVKRIKILAWWHKNTKKAEAG